mgnify:CR=1 FL=1
MFKPIDYKLINVSNGRIFDDEGWSLADPEATAPSLVRAVYNNTKFTPRDDLKGVGHHGGIFRGDLPAGADVGLGDDQEMGGRLGVDVVKGVHQLVLVDLVGGDLPRRDLAEEAVAHTCSLLSSKV